MKEKWSKVWPLLIILLVTMIGISYPLKRLIDLNSRLIREGEITKAEMSRLIRGRTQNRPHVCRFIDNKESEQVCVINENGSLRYFWCYQELQGCFDSRVDL